MPGAAGGRGALIAMGVLARAALDLASASTERRAIRPDGLFAINVSGLVGRDAELPCRMAQNLEEFDLGWLEGVLPHDDAVGSYGGGGIPHSWSRAINTAFALPVLAIVSTTHIFEVKLEPDPMQHELVKVPSEIMEGMIPVPLMAGLEFEAKEQLLDHVANPHPVAPTLGSA